MIYSCVYFEIAWLNSFNADNFKNIDACMHFCYNIFSSFRQRNIIIKSTKKVPTEVKHTYITNFMIQITS